MTISREQAALLASAAAKANPPHYYEEPFKPHEWVIDAILLAREPLVSENRDLDVLVCSLKLDEAMHRANNHDLCKQVADLTAQLSKRTQECVGANERLQQVLGALRYVRKLVLTHGDFEAINQTDEALRPVGQVRGETLRVPK